MEDNYSTFENSKIPLMDSQQSMSGNSPFDNTGNLSSFQNPQQQIQQNMNMNGGGMHENIQPNMPRQLTLSTPISNITPSGQQPQNYNESSQVLQFLNKQFAQFLPPQQPTQSPQIIGGLNMSSNTGNQRNIPGNQSQNVLTHTIDPVIAQTNMTGDGRYATLEDIKKLMSLNQPIQTSINNTNSSTNMSNTHTSNDKNDNNNSIFDITLNELKLPLIVVLLIIAFSHPQVNEFLLKNIPYFSLPDGEIGMNMIGLVFKAIVAGVLFYVLTKVFDISSTSIGSKINIF